jgi:hypothetical protein
MAVGVDTAEATADDDGLSATPSLAPVFCERYRFCGLTYVRVTELRGDTTMKVWSRIALAAALVLGGSLAACGPDVNWDDPDGPIYIGANDGGFLGDGGASTSPILAKIDPSATMVQTPGLGVGVFTQYEPSTKSKPGGHWYIWWTCDTTTSNQDCEFAVTATVAHGDITNASAEGFTDTDTLTGGGLASDGGTGDDGGDAGVSGGRNSSSSITAETYTTTTVQGIRFDTEPGAVINLSASLGGEYSGSFLFFVQDGSVNGGYTGNLTDPLDLQSSSP